MIKGQNPKALTAATIKEKARNSASVLSSLVLSGNRNTKYGQDTGLVLHYVGIALLAKSLREDILKFRYSNIALNVDTLLTMIKIEIKNELQFLENDSKN